MPGILGRRCVSRILEPTMTEEEIQRITAERGYAQTRKQADRCTRQRLVEEGPGYLDVTGHSYLSVPLQRVAK
jgi:hypothetical protein